MTQFRKRWFGAFVLAGSALAVSACSTIEPHYSARPGGKAPPPAASAVGGYKVGKPYQVRGQWYYPAEQPNYDETGLASWYGDAFNGKPTANGEIFNMNAISAAHKTLPLPSLVEVTNLDNGRSLQLRVNDRGPFVDGRIIDLSRAAAEQLGILRPGLAKVRVRYVGPATIPGQGRVTIARAEPPMRVAAAPVARSAPPLSPPIQPQAIEAAAAAPPAITQVELAPPQQELAFASEPAPSLATNASQSVGSYEVQAGAFSDRANAERIATQLADAGLVEIQPIERNGATLYRVMVRDIGGETEADAIRSRVAGIGLADARIIRPF